MEMTDILKMMTCKKPHVPHPFTPSSTWGRGKILEAWLKDGENYEDGRRASLWSLAEASLQLRSKDSSAIRCAKWQTSTPLLCDVLCQNSNESGSMPKCIWSWYMTSFLFQDIIWKSQARLSTWFIAKTSYHLAFLWPRLLPYQLWST